MKHLLPDVLFFIGGLYLYGLRNLFGKWLVIHTLSFAKLFLIKTERHFRVYWHYYFEELHKSEHKSK